MVSGNCVEPESRNYPWGGRNAVVAAVAAMIPPVAALTGWRFLNPALVDGLLQAQSEVVGFDASPQALRQMERHLLDLAFAHQIELPKGPWLDDLPDFVRRNALEGLCALYLMPFDDTEADVFRMKFRYLVCFSDHADASMFRLTFG